MRLSDHVTLCHFRRHGANPKTINDTIFRRALSRGFLRDHGSFAGGTKLPAVSDNVYRVVKTHRMLQVAGCFWQKSHEF